MCVLIYLSVNTSGPILPSFPGFHSLLFIVCVSLYFTVARQPSCWHRVTAGWNERNQWHASLHHLLMFLRDLQGGDMGQKIWNNCCHPTNREPKTAARKAHSEIKLCVCVRLFYLLHYHLHQHSLLYPRKCMHSYIFW